MKIYLDSANLTEISEAAKTGLIDGVTTNPSLVSKEGLDFKSMLKEIIKILKMNCDDFTVSAEVTDTNDYKSILENARALSKIDKHIVVKVPLTMEGLKAVKILEKEKIRCNVTLCFSANQALLAAKAGAFIVSPFVGRIEDEGWVGIDLVKDIREIYDNFGYKTQILGASIRSAEHVFECAKYGIDIVTIPYGVFKKLYHNPLTDLGLEKFSTDWNEYQKKVNK